MDQSLPLADVTVIEADNDQTSTLSEEKRLLNEKIQRYFNGEPLEQLFSSENDSADTDTDEIHVDLSSIFPESVRKSIGRGRSSSAGRSSRIGSHDITHLLRDLYATENAVKKLDPNLDEDIEIPADVVPDFAKMSTEEAMQVLEKLACEVRDLEVVAVRKASENFHKEMTKAVDFLNRKSDEVTKQVTKLLEQPVARVAESPLPPEIVEMIGGLLEIENEISKTKKQLASKKVDASEFFGSK